jgi:MoxR-like ATPase
MEENKDKLEEKRDLPTDSVEYAPSEADHTRYGAPDENQVSFARTNEDLIWLAGKVNEMRVQTSQYIIGQEEMTELLLAGIFASGHILLEGVPGVAKTLASKVLAKVIDVDFSRIQFTPDLMPSDVIGTSIFNMKESKFEFRKGPIFSNIVLIDEINRAPAKTQSALFEVMEERQITYDGSVYPLETPFLVVATQNPIEQEGTYSLPEAQLDRFLFKINLDYPTLDQEKEILHRYKNNIKTPSLDKIKPVLTAKDVVKVQEIVEQIMMEDVLIDYIAQIVNKTRNHGKIYLGGSPRASLAILRSSKAMAAIRGRDFVTPDDIQFVAPQVLNHRLILTPEADMEAVTTRQVVDEILQTIEVPR